MGNTVQTISIQALIMFILVFFGYILYRKKLISEETTKQISNITLMIINPIVIFNAYQKEFDPALLQGLALSALLAVVSNVVLIAAASILIKRGRGNFEVERFAMAYSNCAFLGIPLVEATLGSTGVFYLTGYITVFNFFMWTHGVLVMSGKQSRGIKQKAQSLLKVLVSPAIIAIALGMVFFFTGLRLPQVVQTAVNHIGNMNTPLAMLVSGASIAKSGLLRGFKCKRVYFVQAFKLLIIPIFLCAIFVPLIPLGVPIAVIATVITAASAPTASAIIMFSYKHERDVEYASSMFAVSTVLSIATIPLVQLVLILFASMSGHIV